MSAVLEQPGKVWTHEDYLLLDDDSRHEIIAGRLLVSPAPELFHQRWARALFLLLQRHVEARGLGEVLFAPIDVVLDRENVVQPDLVFVTTAKSGLLEPRGIMGAPDLVVEIISAGSLRRDRYDKRDLYARFGVKEYWLADVANRSLEILVLRDGAYRLAGQVSDEGVIRSEVLPGLEVDLQNLP